MPKLHQIIRGLRHVVDGFRGNRRRESKQRARERAEAKRTFRSFFDEYRDLEFPIWFILAGALGLWVGFSRSTQATESRSWPQATGRVVAVDLHSRESGGGKTLGEGHSASTRLYEPSIEYEFSVGPNQYRSNHRSFAGNSFDDPAQARAVLERYQVGQEVTVHYDPEKPKRSVIELEPVALVNTFTIIGSVFGLAGLALMGLGVVNVIRHRMR